MHFLYEGEEECSCTVRAEGLRAQGHSVLCVAALSPYSGCLGQKCHGGGGEGGGSCEFQMSYRDLRNVFKIRGFQAAPGRPRLCESAAGSLWLYLDEPKDHAGPGGRGPPDFSLPLSARLQAKAASSPLIFELPTIAPSTVRFPIAIPLKG